MAVHINPSALVRLWVGIGNCRIPGPVDGGWRFGRCGCSNQSRRAAITGTRIGKGPNGPRVIPVTTLERRRTTLHPTSAEDAVAIRNTATPVRAGQPILIVGSPISRVQLAVPAPAFGGSCLVRNHPSKGVAAMRDAGISCRCGTETS